MRNPIHDSMLIHMGKVANPQPPPPDHDVSTKPKSNSKSARLPTTKRLARLRNRRKRHSEPSYLTGIPNELIDRIASHLDVADIACLAVTCPQFYLSLRPSLANLSDWQALECRRHLRRVGYFDALQLPCFTCFELHPTTAFYAPELKRRLPQCIAQSRVWRCACAAVTADQIRQAAGYEGGAVLAIPTLRDLFAPCSACRDDEGLVCTEARTCGLDVRYHHSLAGHGFNVRAVGRPLLITNEIRFPVMLDVGADDDEQRRRILRDATAAHCRGFNFPLCRHLSLSDAMRIREEGPFDPATPLTECPAPHCELRFGIAHAYRPGGADGDEWDVTVTISRRLPPASIEESWRKSDRLWTSLAMTDAEMVGKMLPRMFEGKDRKSARTDLRALLESMMVRQGTWAFETSLLKHFWRRRGSLRELCHKR